MGDLSCIEVSRRSTMGHSWVSMAHVCALGSGGVGRKQQSAYSLPQSHFEKKGSHLILR